MRARRAAVPPGISYPPQLPVSQHREEIARAIAAHQVVIVAGETGSGKTTQLPKICLELGRGVAGQIGHTQPRRLAARTIAERVAAELGTELGAVVGYQVRFTDASSDQTMIKLMTDGILLAELQRDRRLLRYDTLIIDEAHERSLNVDFILGYLRRLLPTRPDLKVIITSATIDPGRFARHFGGAPVIEVSGRTYPVQVRYRPLEAAGGGEPRDQVQGICDAVDELSREGRGDVLVFLSGEREIQDAADALTAPGGPADRHGLEVLPLFARLPAARQHLIFQPHQRRRVVLATNVAETSLTVPGVGAVIDAGTARISRYSPRAKVQRLPIEPVSKASARQRAGRCGRTGDGVCIRLYGEEDFASRPEFTEPEILRTNLASVVLRMAALGLGDVADFPFIDPPDTRNVADGVRLLAELGAIEPGARAGALRLTATGRRLARLPVDPRIGRMILEADRNDCAREVLVIAAALSIQDVRERPADQREQADACHARFAGGGSDFLALLRLWEYLRERQRALSSSALRRLCRREYLHYLRVREWQDLYGQLRQAAGEVGVAVRPGPGDRGDQGVPGELADRIHRSLLAGLLSHIGMRDDRPARGRRRGPAEFAGAGGTRFAIFPDSALARKPPPWLMAAELAETSRLWARTVARIEPEWAEALAPHLVRRSYAEPHWDARSGTAMTLERVTLYGLPVVAGRRVPLGRVDPATARDMFITHALVEGDWQTRHRFFHRNRALIERARELERRARRRGVVADDAALHDFYASRIPAEVTSARHFDSWWKKAREASPDLLTLRPADLAGPAAGEVSESDYPDRWGGAELRYEFAPGEPGDGITARIPLEALPRIRGEEFSWQVPGFREELVTELIRSLPKALRTAFVPVPQTAKAVAARLDRARHPGAGLAEALAAELGRIAGAGIPADAFDLERLPPHLRVSFEVADGGVVLGAGRDLDDLRRRLRPAIAARVAQAGAGLARSGLRSWDFGALPREVTSGPIRVYPALADAGDTVDIAVFETAEEAEKSMRAGTRRLLLLEVPSGARAVAGRLPAGAKLAMSTAPGGIGALLDDCAMCAADEIIAEAGGPAWDAAGFAALAEAGRAAQGGLRARAAANVSAAAAVMVQAQQVAAALDRAPAALAAAVGDMRAQLAGLIRPGFVTATGSLRLPDLVRYLRAMAHRLERAPRDLAKDAERMAVVGRVTAAYEQAMARNGDVAGLAAVRWMIEELRVSLFAQGIGAAIPVSERRVLAAIERAAGTPAGAARQG